MAARSASPTPESLAWRRDGVVPLRGLIERDWLDLLREAAWEIRDEVACREPDKMTADEEIASDFFTRLDLWMMNEKVARFMCESRLAEVAANVMESEEIRLYHDILIMKDQIVEQPTPWHQDEPSWEAVGNQLCGIWFSLDPVTEETASLRFVRGSHKGPRYSHPKVLCGAKTDLDREGGPLPDVDADPERYPVLSYDLEAGDAVLFHPSMLHSSLGCKREGPRISYALRMMGDDVRWMPCPSSIHACGEELGFEPGDRLIADRFPLLWQHG